MNGKELQKEFGDYQTPLEFAIKVCRYLKQYLNISPEVILEPTCGIGNFIRAGIEVFDNIEKAYGVEINADYCKECKNSFDNDKVDIICDNYFSFNPNTILSDTDNLLIIGNPPWATNSALNFNLPVKNNFKKLTGTDAITGASNFDICEYIILKLLSEFRNSNVTIAMLCKKSVARNVFKEIAKSKCSAEYVKIVDFDAKKIFGISASACLFIVKLSGMNIRCNACKVSDFESPDKIGNIIMYDNGVLSNSVDSACDFDGRCQLEWRQGIKHDCSSIMELKMISDNLYLNKKNDIIELEDKFVFPLLKSSSLKKAVTDSNFDKYVIVTQKKVREETAIISYVAPLTWKYLTNNKELFDKRKSSIYKGAPPFSMFGVGKYSYSQYKVGISGFYKKPLFSLIYNRKNTKKPVMLDDTSYFISFDDYDTAYVYMLLLNCEKVQEFLNSISFIDAKRPYTKKVLQRIDFKKCIKYITLSDLMKTEDLLGIDKYITDVMYEKVKVQILYGENEQISMF